MAVTDDAGRPASPAAALRPLRFTWPELAGGAGDLGLLLPLAVAMVAVNGLSATAVFGGAGLVYIVTALVFRVPVPVQPLKAFAAAAIALELDAGVIAAGALPMATTMAILGATGLAGWLADRFPVVLVRGIQASVALLLLKAAWSLAERGNWTGLPAVATVPSVLAAVAVCGLLLVLTRRPRVPGVLLVLGAGALAGALVGSLPPDVGLGPSAVTVGLPSGDDAWTALTTLVLAQLPLTFGNSIVATADAERVYFGAAARRVSETRLAWSIAGANLLAAVTHGLPLCHGAGGVTAHVRTGARTAGSTLMVGAALVVLALLFGDDLPRLTQVILPGVLAGMLAFVAVHHGLLAASVPDCPARFVVALTGAVTIVAGNLAWGVAAGAAALAIGALVRRFHEAPVAS